MGVDGLLLLDKKLSGGFRIFDADDEDRSSLADVCAELIELVVLDSFLLAHALGLE